MAYKDLAQQRQYQANWMWRRRMAWILANGPCSVCRTTQDLQVVYKDPADRKVRVTAIWSRKEADRERLLALCIVLCRTCALDKRTMDRQPEHGELGRYDQGCRCVPCRGAKSISMAKYRAQKREGSAHA